MAIKILLTELEREWRQSPDVVLASDAHGVVFLASRDAWRYRLLAPLTPQARQELEATRQYTGQPLAPLGLQVERRVDEGTVLARAQEPPLPGPLLWHTQAETRNRG